MKDFRYYIRTWARARGRGEFRKISLALNMHTTLISQILNGKKCLTEEQASQLCVYMGLTQLETDCFLKLIQIERAGTENLKNIYKRQLQEIRTQATEVRSRVPESKELNEQDRALFYSSWQYSLVRLLTSIEHFQTAPEIAQRLNLSISRAQEILDFLTSRGLCKEAHGRYMRTEKNTHIEAHSSLVVRHHQNWRNKSIEFQERITPEDLVFTAPVSISKKDVPKIRTILLDAISDIAKLIELSSSEEVVYLGIDWIKM